MSTAVLPPRPHGRQLALYGLCLLLGAVAFALVPGDDRQKFVAAVFAVTVGLWITEALPLAVTAILSTAFLVVLGGLDGKTAFGSFGNPVILLFVGSFFLSKALEVSGLARRIALGLLRRPWVGRSDGRLLLGLGGVICLLSQVVSSTATTAMMLPVVLAVVASFRAEMSGGKATESLLLMTTWGASVALGTAISTPPNMIGIALIREQAGREIGFLQWSLFGIPLSLGLFFAAWMYLRMGMKGDQGLATSAHAFAVEESKSLGRMTQREWNIVIAFGVAMVLWLVPGVLNMAMGPDHEWTTLVDGRFPSAVAALLGAGLLFVLPCASPSGATLSWDEAKTIDWGTILLFAGGLALGTAVFDSGLAQMMGDWVAGVTGGGDVWVIMAICMVLATVMSETASNTASATVMVPIAIAIAQGAGVSPVAPALGAVVASSLGFMFPVSTPPNAIVFSSGKIPLRTMMARGFWFDLIALATAFVLLRLLLPALGFV